MNVNYTTSNCELNNDLIIYAIEEIESIFNVHYNIEHNTVLIIVDDNHCIDLSCIPKYSKIEEYLIFSFQDYKSNKFVSQKDENLSLVLKLRKLHNIDDVSGNTEIVFPFYISFQTNSQLENSIIGTLRPEVHHTEDEILFLRPAQIVISEFDSK